MQWIPMINKMGHHPPPAIGAEQVSGISSGLSPNSWLLIIIGVIIVGIIIYYTLKKRGN